MTDTHHHHGVVWLNNNKIVRHKRSTILQRHPNHPKIQDIDWETRHLRWSSPLHWQDVQDSSPGQQAGICHEDLPKDRKERTSPIPDPDSWPTRPGKTLFSERNISLCSGTWLTCPAMTKCWVVEVWSLIGQMRLPSRRLPRDPRLSWKSRKSDDSCTGKLEAEIGESEISPVGETTGLKCIQSRNRYRHSKQWISCSIDFWCSGSIRTVVMSAQSEPC